MQRLVAITAMGLLISASVGSHTWAQLGNPTAPPPGSPNSPGTAGTTRSPRPAGTAGTTRAPGTARPPGTTQTARPATIIGQRLSQPPGARTDSGVVFGQQGFGQPGATGFNNTGPNNIGIGGNRFGGGTTQMMFERNAAMFNGSDASSVGNPATAIPGRPNMSGGSTSRTLRPGARIAGEPNDTSLGPGSAPFAPRPNLNRDVFLDGFVSGLNVPVTPVTPIVPSGAGVQATTSADVAPTVPPTQVVPVIVSPAEAQARSRNNVEVTVQPAPREPVIPQTGVATATAYPARNPSATGDATVMPVPPTAVAAQQQAVEATAGAEATTTYRGAPSSTGQRSDLTFSYPGYTQWQGYYWYHTPAAGWRYWDGQRWVQFVSVQD